MVNFLKTTTKSTSELFVIFETHCVPRKNVTIQRKLFYEMKQSSGETIDEWIAQLRLIATDCEFHNQDEMIRDMIALNYVNKKVQERLLETDDLDQSKALKIAKIHETNIEQMKLISNSDVHYVGSRRERKPATRQRYVAPPVRRTDGARPKTWRSPDVAECSNCGRIHTIQTCPAQDKTFHNIGKPNHFAAMCRSTAPTQSAAVRQRKRPQRVHPINDADYDTSGQESTIGCLSASVNTVHSGGQPHTTHHVGCDNVPMKFKVDTGAQINVIPITAFDTLAETRMKQLKPTQVRLTGYSGNVEPTTGTCRIECKLREKPHTLEFFSIADTHATPILGFDSCRAMGLVKIENRVLKMIHTEVAAVKTVDLPPTIPKDIAEEYPELFQGLGQFPRIHTMQTRPEVQPVVHASRRVPFALRGRLKSELDKKESLGVIVKVDEPKDWVNSIKIVEKKIGSLRICLDPRDLNKALKREHYSCPTVDDIAAIYTVLECLPYLMPQVYTGR